DVERVVRVADVVGDPVVDREDLAEVVLRPHVAHDLLGHAPDEHALLATGTVDCSRHLPQRILMSLETREHVRRLWQERGHEYPDGRRQEAPCISDFTGETSVTQEDARRMGAGPFLSRAYTVIAARMMSPPVTQLVPLPIPASSVSVSPRPFRQVPSGARPR